ncbi:o-succinylbenzoate synthase [Pseudonocardia ailaonensis]|uniref:o-succinylbenzoate synthase n=1 Tax=Pseudonocardia ailaonensis TaxID=367279 RepID=A0ABN2NC49_9PSEU
MDEVAVYSIPLTTRFRGITTREGLLFRGPAGWGEFCPFPEYDDREAATWLAAAREAAFDGWPEPRRDSVPVNCIVPAVAPSTAADMVRASGCATAKVKVADHPGSAGEDRERVAAVRDALGPSGFVRVDANTAWDVDTAVREIRALDAAAGGLQYVEQPCAALEELAAVRRRVDVRIAADEVIRRAVDPLAVPVADAADVAILKCLPLGGVRRALRVAEAVGLPCVVSSALESSVGLAAEIALAAALPELDYACGLGTGRLFTTDVVAEDERLIPRDGALPVLRTAPEPVRRAEVAAGPDRAAWWRERLERLTER